MQKFGWLSVILAIAALFSSPAAKAEEATVSGPITLSGKGCSPADTDFAITADGKTVSVLFSTFEVNTGSSAGKSHDAKLCEVFIPLSVPSGFKIKVNKMDYRGFRFLSKKTDYDWAIFENRITSGNVTTSSGLTIFGGHGPVNEDLFYQPNRSVTSAKCGGAMVLRIKTQLIADTLACHRDGQATFAMDSIDFTTHLGGQFQYIPCR